MLKILVATPTYDGMEYCFKEFLECIKAIDYENFDILVVDNSRTKKFFRKIKNISKIKVIYDETNENENMRRLISSRNKILDYAIKKDYDYVLMVDSDVLVPPNILNKLLSNEKDICSGLYFGYFNIFGKRKILPVCWKELEKEIFEDLKKQGKIPEKFKSNLELRRHLTEKEIDSRKLIEVIIPSAGCMLISKNVFSNIRYKFIPKTETENKTPTDEIYFLKKAREKGFKIYCDTSVICRHNIEGKYNKIENPFQK